jgi:hypothetical protein
VSRQVVQYDDIPRRQRRPQDPRDVGPKDLGIRGPIDRHDRLKALEAYRAQPRDSLSIVLRNGPNDPLACGSPAIQACHGEIDTGFIHELQAPEIKRGGPLPVGGAGLLDPRRVAFGGMEGLFFRASPRRLRRRHMVAALTRTPRCCWSWPQSSSNVASGWPWTKRRT